MQEIVEIYSKQIADYNARLSILSRRRSRLGLLRFIVFALMVAVVTKTFIAFGWMGILPLVIGIAILLFLVSRDVQNNARIRHVKQMIGINQEETRILRGDYQHRYDGASLTPALHPFAHDLDILGPSSVFQWLNRAHSEGGRMQLAHDLLVHLNRSEILQRQQAVKELSPLMDWRQQFQALSERTTITASTEKRVRDWLESDQENFKGTLWRWIVPFYTITTLTIAGATIFGIIPASAFSAAFGLMLITSQILGRNTIKPYILLSRIVPEISTLEALLAWLEKPDFQHPLLKGLQGTDNDKLPSLEIGRLKRILDRFDQRLNLAGIILFNTFLLWDVRQMMALNKWRKENRINTLSWFENIADMETLHSLATLQFNKPDWSIPEPDKDFFSLSAKDLGHPLIPEASRVTSNFHLDGTGKIALVTGSNMAGKSTFLRSLGVNMVLAQAGAVVCASSFSFSPANIMSSMRIADNLADNTSTFYAELKNLKRIIESVNRKERIFILLDEILRGTNSLDRHTGSAALIRQLIAKHAVAVIATHDVELAALESEFPSIENYHFDVQVAGEELYFDYRLKHGVCTSLNASLLMKKIGIELE